MSPGFEPLEDRRLLAAVFRDGEIIVQFAPAADDAARDAARAAIQGRALEAIETAAMRRQGAGGALERISLGRGVSVERAIQALANQPGVLFAEPNYLLTTSAVSNDPYYTTSSRLWGMYGDDAPTASGPSGTTNQFGSQAEKAWAAGSTGSKSVIVGILDEGIDVSHPDLAANIWVNPFDPVDGLDNDGNGYIDDVNGWDFVSGNNTVYDAGQDQHGTHVAGTIGGLGGNGVGVAGVSWDVTMISLKFLGPTGGTTANAVRALDYLTDLKTRHGINIVASNNSWGGGGYSSALHGAIIRAANAGILFVAAAGNGGGDGIGDSNDSVANYPSNYSTLAAATGQPAASYESVIAVAALTSTGGLASYSNFGATSVDIAAPGSSIWSTLPGNTYGNYNGTSMATPHVTGAVALYASAHPGATASAIRGAILNSARATSSVSGRTVTGGRLDVAAAIGVRPPVGLSISGGSVVEGNSGASPLAFTVSLSTATTTTVTVNYATSGGTATSGTDFVAQSSSLSFAPGETSKTILVDVVGDTAFEANENFTVVLSGASANATITTASATGTITNDDAQPAPPTLSISSVSALENSGTFQFVVTLSAPSTSTVSVRFATANGTATAGKNGDYTSTSGTLSFSPGQTSRTVSVTVRNDSLVEADETFFVDLSRASGAAIAVSRGTGTIRNDDGMTAVFAALAAAAADDADRPAPKRR
jgi:subtilisin family serine protease